MKTIKILGALVLGAIAGASQALAPDAVKVCDECEKWNSPHEPFRVYGNTYYVGTRGLSSVVIATDQGLILIDGGLTQSAQRIDENIRKLGFDTKDIRLILNSHAHFDHAGGINALQRASGAQVAASPWSATPLKTGKPGADDPQFGYADYFPPMNNVRVIQDGETLQLGKQSITAHFTPGHTPGGTSWTWRSCEGEKCLDIVYADSLTALKGPGYSYSDEKAHPGVVAGFRRSFATVADLPCDILLTSHPTASFMDKRLARPAAGKGSPLVEEAACRVYAVAAAIRLNQLLAAENTTPQPKPAPKP